MFAGQEPLNWLQRLNIALDSAYGTHEVMIFCKCGTVIILEIFTPGLSSQSCTSPMLKLSMRVGLHYLHKSCGRPLIHRDVKAVKILLTADLEAKISDFGLTRAFSSEMSTHTTTRPVITCGYLDPEYACSYSSFYIFIGTATARMN